MRHSILFLLFPAATLVITWPAVSDLPPIRLEGAGNMLDFVWAAPYWLGVLCAPGYIYAWSGRYSDKQHPVVRLWVQGSLVGAVLASTVGLAFSALSLVAIPTGLASVVCAALQLRKYVTAAGQAKHC
jgi:hypothetical protein